MRRRRRAFTLIEVVVTLVVLGVLASMGALALIAFGNRADTSTAQASINQVEVAEHSLAATYGGYSAWPADISAGSGVTVTDGPSTSSSVVSVAVGVDGSLALAALTQGGSCVAVGVTSLDASPPASPTTVQVPGPSCTGLAALDAAWPGDTPTQPTSVRW